MTVRPPGAPLLLFLLPALLTWISAAALAALDEGGGWGFPLAVALGLAALLLLGLALLAERRAARRLAAAIRAAAAADSPLRPPDDPELAAALRTVVDAIQSTRGLLGQSQSERSQFEHALSAAGDAVLALNAAGRIAYLNPAARAALSRPDTASAARLDAPLIDAAPDPDLYAAVEAALGGGGPQSLQIQLGERRYRAAVAPLGEGGTWSVVAALHDLTEQHEAETARRDFFINASHELRTPLATVSAAAETLGRARDEAAAERFRGIIQVEVERMSQLVEEMLALARLESGLSQPDLQILAAAPLLEGAAARMRPQAEHQGLEISCRTDPAGAVMIEVDPDLVQRALLNLIQNAIKFTPAGGSIEVLADREAPPHGDPAMLWIRVRDTGIGVEPAEQGRIFQRFYRIDRARAVRGGTGLGLAVVRHIAEVHGGAVALESEVGRGSTFAFSVPLAAPVVDETDDGSLTTP